MTVNYLDVQLCVTPDSQFPDSLDNFLFVGLADLRGKGHVVFPVSFALSGSGLIAKTQKFKLYGLMVFFSMVLFAVGNMRLTLIDHQLYFRQPVE